MFWSDIEVETRGAEWDEQDFEEYLNDTFGDVEVCGYVYGVGTILREIDPIAFNVEMGDTENPEEVYICPECGEEHESEEEAKECCYCYECPECGQFYTDEQGAIACCGYYEVEEED